MVPQDLQDLLGPLALHLERQAHKEMQELMGLMEHPVPMEPMEPQKPQEPMELQDLFRMPMMVEKPSQPQPMLS